VTISGSSSALVGGTEAGSVSASEGEGRTAVEDDVAIGIEVSEAIMLSSRLACSRTSLSSCASGAKRLEVVTTAEAVVERDDGTGDEGQERARRRLRDERRAWEQAPWALQVAPSGAVYVASQDFNAIVVFLNATASLVSSSAGMASSSGLASSTASLPASSAVSPTSGGGVVSLSSSQVASVSSVGALSSSVAASTAQTGGSSSSSGLSHGAIAGIVIGSVVGALLLCLLAMLCVRSLTSNRQKKAADTESASQQRSYDRQLGRDESRGGELEMTDA
jgi:hypothetical protein